MSLKNNKAKDGKKSSKFMENAEECNISVQQIRQLFLEMFKTHEENIVKIISANNKIVNDRIDQLEKKIDDIQESLEYTENDLKVKLTQFENKQTHLNDEFRNKVRELEDRSRRNNLRIDGINESVNESWNESEQKVSEMFANKLGLNNIVIERAHRGNLSKHQKDMKKPRTIILKLLSYKDKEKIMVNVNKLKNSGIYVNEDFSKDTIEIRKKLWENVLKLRREGKYAVLRYDKIFTREFRK